MEREIINNQLMNLKKLVLMTQKRERGRPQRCKNPKHKNPTFHPIKLKGK